MGYGFPVMGVEDWTVMDNVDLSTHVATRSEPLSCIDFAQPATSGFQIDLTRSWGTFQEEYQGTQLGLLLEPFDEQYVFSPSCLSDLLGADAFNEIKNGEHGSVLYALEEADGGRFMERCITPFEIPDDTSDALVNLTLEACGSSCVTLKLHNTGSDAVDMSAAAFLLENFLVDCVGLPQTIPADGKATCQIHDYIYEGAPLLLSYGFKASPRVFVFGFPLD